MTWHANHQTEEGSMCHQSDAATWGHFDWTYPNFAAGSQNVRLNLCTDGFALHGQYDRTYSCWLVILTPYNFSPEMCMSSGYMFLTMVIPNPSNLKYLIDVYLEPLIEELQNLWHVGVLTHDNAKNETFTMSVVLMWTVNNLPAYWMESGWSMLVLWGVQFVWMTLVHSICNTVGRRAIDCYRQPLPYDHPYYRNKKTFNKNRVERKIAHPTLMGEEIL